jgi:hypothetical protein
MSRLLRVVALLALKGVLFNNLGFFPPNDEGNTLLRNLGSNKSSMASLQEDGILHSHRCENLKSYIALTG